MPSYTAKNHLSNAQSPYLLQHADNPVHWFPWSDEAFAAAKEQDKPVFLSIGYATCHWCHVMAHESFEDEEVARMMNETFISIKVDREERPDIDNTYMRVCQLLTGQGGWPLTILMTPEKKPFFAATYLPKNSRGRQTGLLELIPQIEKFWQNDRQNIEGSAQKITKAFQESIQPNDRERLPANILDVTRDQLDQQFDDEYGGFSQAPKFPTPYTLIYLLKYADAFDDNRAREMTKETLIHMQRGGIFDQLGGGFHRYSTDRQWLVPHFEKMLYDQAMHLMAYAEAWQSLENPLFKRTAQKIASYLFRDMQNKNGAFYSAEDADSEGTEGAFYVWTQDEINEVLPEGDAELAIDIFNIELDGNYSDEATGQSTGKNILHRTRLVEALAEEHDLPEDEFRQKLGEIRCKLFGYREKRERPFLDDKILTDWNGLTAAALAKAGRMLDEPEYIEQAKRAVEFIFENLTTEDDRLFHRFRRGKGAISGTADDYAFLIRALLELYESTFESDYLRKAVELQKVFLKTHWDEENGGFYFTPQQAETLLGRKKEYYDSAAPSGNSVSMMNLLRLGRICAKPEWEEKAEEIAQSTAEKLSKAPTSFTELLQAQLWLDQPGHEIVIAGEKEDAKTQEFLNALNEEYIPQSVVILNDPENDDIREMVPYLEHQPMVDGKPTAYVCQNYACKEPTHDVEKMVEILTAD